MSDYVLSLFSGFSAICSEVELVTVLNKITTFNPRCFSAFCLSSLCHYFTEVVNVHLTACVLFSGFLDSEPLREADEDMASEINLNNCLLTEEEREEIQQQLAKVCSHWAILKHTLKDR